MDSKKYKTPKIDLFLFPNISFLKTDCPYVITAHDISFEFFPEFLSLKRKFWHKYINPKKLFQEATKIITVSKNTEQDLINHYLIQPQKVRTILSGISPNYKILKRNDQCPSPNDQKFKKIRKKYNLPEKFILFLGTIEPRKNINTLIDAFNQFKQNTDSDLSLVIAGKLGWKFKQESKKTRKQESIHLPGFILDSEKRYFYNLAEMFVYPSYYEGFGFPPLEAMACGCPVITANNSSLSEICQNAALLVDPTNINDLVAAIQEIQAPETKNFFIKKGLKHCKQFSWYRTARELLQLFEEIKK